MQTSKLSIRYRRLLLLVILLILVGVVIFIPLPQTFTTPCLIEPKAIWFLMRDGNSQIVTGWQQNLLGSAGTRTLIQFERPNIIEIQLSEKLTEGGRVAKGDTVAIIHSNITEESILVLEAERDKALAELNALQTGERLEDQEILEREVKLAEVALNEYIPTYERVRDLYNAGTASLSEWQMVQAKHQLLSVELEVAKSKLAASRAPARPEDIEIARCDVKRLQQMIENLRNSLQQMRIVVAPTDGIAHLGDDEGFLLRIDQTDTMTAVVPIPEAIVAKLDQTKPIELKLFAETPTIRYAQINRIDFRDILGFSAGVITLLDNSNRRLRAGMNGVAKLSLGRITIWEGLSVRLKGISR